MRTLACWKGRRRKLQPDKCTHENWCDSGNKLLKVITQTEREREREQKRERERTEEQY